MVRQAHHERVEDEIATLTMSGRARVAVRLENAPLCDKMRKGNRQNPLSRGDIMEGKVQLEITYCVP